MYIHKRKKAVVMKLRTPSKVTSVITTARQVGAHTVALPHRPDETRVLRNLGFDVPDPMPLHYDYPLANGRFNPFEVQRSTASFLSMNRRAFCLNDMGCVDAATEYLSPTGWVRMDSYTGGPVAQYHPGTGTAEFVEPTQYVKLPCSDMLRIKTVRGVDQLLSLEHRVLLRARADEAKTEVLPAASLWARQNTKGTRSADRIGWSQAAIPVTFTLSGAGLAFSEAHIRLQVAVIADGHFPSKTLQCVVRLKKPRKILRLRALLANAQVAYQERVITKNDNRTDVGFHVFKFAAPMHDKEFGADWWQASAAQLDFIRDEVMHWDGSVSPNPNRGPRFSSISKASADFVQYVYVTGGHSARVAYDPRGCYEVLVRPCVTSIGLSGSNAGVRTIPITPEPSTDGFKYCFVVPSTFLVFRRNGCVFLSGNTGKTNSALWAYDYLRSIKQAQRMLVVCPLSTMERTWGDGVFSTFPHLDAVVVYGSRERRLKLLNQPNDVYIINIDGVDIIKKELAHRPDIDVIVVDELAMARNARTHRWETLNVICNKQTPRRVWGMTGSPTPNSPTDAWAQCRLITPDNPEVPRFFGRFKDSVMRQITPFKWIAKPTATDTVFRCMQPAIRYSLDDCVDLPDQIVLTRDVELSKEQDRAYKEMMTRLAVEAAGGQILAVNEAVKANKLIQIACGVAYGTQGENLVIPSQPRIDAVKEIIEESEGKVIVFVPLTGALELIAAEISTMFKTPKHVIETVSSKLEGGKGINSMVSVVHGGTSKTERDRIFKEFQQQDEPRVLVANAQTMSHGLTLTAATTIVWYAPVHSNETYEQACARVRRPGQTKKTVIVHIASTPAERTIYKRLAAKQSMQGVLLDMIQENNGVEA